MQRFIVLTVFCYYYTRFATANPLAFECLTVYENSRLTDVDPTVDDDATTLLECHQICRRTGYDTCTAYVFNSEIGSCKLYDQQTANQATLDDDDVLWHTVVRLKPYCFDDTLIGRNRRAQPPNATTTTGGQWDNWQAWGACSLTCGKGQKKRTRLCKTYQPCQGPKEETQECQVVPCPGQLTEWGPWSKCSVLCGGGFQTRNRSCSSYGGCGNEQLLQNQTCNPHSCCNNWSAWSPCSVTCGSGTQKRSHRCMVDAPGTPSGYASQEKTETQNCTAPVPCSSWSPWTPWSQCPVTCGGGNSTRKRDCKPPGATCQGNPTETQKCNPQPCPAWSNWGPWTPCSDTCGGGWHIRQRNCTQNNQPASGCPGDEKEKEVCNGFACPDFGPWSEWTPCSATCGSGTRGRKRECANDPQFCSGANATLSMCVCTTVDGGKDSENETCNPQACPAPSPWSDWSPCSATCGGGTSGRQRQCKKDDQYCAGPDANPASCQCDGAMDENQNCNPMKCPGWGPWQEWSPCSVTCGGGTRQRNRTCDTDQTYCTPDKASEAVCQCKDGTNMESSTCSPDACPQWQPWQQWSECSVTCGNGTQTRKRTCSRTDAPCVPGNDTDTQNCDKGPCYTWSSWSEWGDCTTLCGGGSRNRTRQCPVADGCPGLTSDTDICNMMPCPDWSEWSPWSDCTVTCGGGQRSRSRACPIPKACSPGEEYENDPQPCNPNVCPTWSDWENWSACSKTCGQGNRSRKRTCSPIPDGCLGSGDSVEPCFDKPCVLGTNWSQWSPCTATCGNGTQTRSRVSCPAGPPTCPIEEATQACNPQACPQWSNWEAWGTCSKTCGGGQRVRKRTCPVVNGCVGQASEIDSTPCNNFGCGTGRKKRHAH